jgi:multiple sugar transport system ATP-binding protein
VAREESVFGVASLERGLSENKHGRGFSLWVINCHQRKLGFWIESNMATIELRQVEKKFGESFAVKPLDLTIKDGEFVTLLGPSGCGKTTTLRMISGLEAVTSGQIMFNGQEVTWNHPSERNIAFVFQFFALYSHLTAQENIAFPLQAEGEGRDEIKKRVSDVAHMLKIEHLLGKRPGGLSGGDQQRVALARALVRRPAAFLMDEPLGALDAEFRETMRAEIKRLHISQNATTVYVTHDQIEALAMSDRIVVMSNAEVQQAATPTDIYHNPSNLFVARFIGSPGMNLIPGQYANGQVHLQGGNFPVNPGWQAALSRGLEADGKLILGFRPEAVRVHEGGALGGTVYASDLHGGYSMLHIELTPEQIIHARVERRVHYAIGEPIRFDLQPEMVRFFHPTTEKALHHEDRR